jgi:hypothetical protein
VCGEYLPSLLLASVEVSNMQLQFYCPRGTVEDWSPSIVPEDIVVIIIVYNNVHWFIIVVYLNNNYYFLQ